MTTKSLGHVQEILNQRSGDLEAVMRCLPHPPVVVCTPALLSRLMTDTPPDFCARDLGKFWMALSWHLHAATNPAHADKVVKIDHRYYTMQSKAGDMVEWLRAQEIAVLSLGARSAPRSTPQPGSPTGPRRCQTGWGQRRRWR